MTISNSTGKDKEFYAQGKKMFDRLGPQIAINTEVIGYVAPQREWVGLTDEEIEGLRLKTFDAVATNHEVYRAIESKLKEKNT